VRYSGRVRSGFLVLAMLASAAAAEWIGVVECSPQSAAPAFEAELESHRGDSAITDAFFAIVDETWTFDGTQASCVDPESTRFALSMIGALEDPAAFARLDALVWRPLPTSTFDLAADESVAAQALACISTPEAQAEARNIAAHHPSPEVRQDIAATLEDGKCTFADL